MISSAISKGSAEDASFPVPPALDVRIDDGRTMGMRLGSYGFNTGQTQGTRAARTRRGQRHLASADTAWMTHADELLHSAEAGRQSTCAPAKLDSGQLACVPDTPSLEHAPQELCASADELRKLRNERCATAR